MAGTRASVIAYVRTLVQDGDEFSMPDIARSVVEHFKQDAAFMASFMEENLYPVSYDVVQRAVAMTRGPGWRKIGDILVSPDGYEERRKQLRTRWASWLEHAGEKVYPLMKMGRTELAMAASERRERAHDELAKAAFLDTIAARLPDGKTVGEVFTTDQVQEIWDEVAAAQAVPALN